MFSLLSSTKQIAKDFFASRLWPKRPQSLLVEITAACDARCMHCPRLAMNRAMKPMPLPVWRKLEDEAAALGVPEFIPNGYGKICQFPSPIRNTVPGKDGTSGFVSVATIGSRRQLARSYGCEEPTKGLSLGRNRL